MVHRDERGRLRFSPWLCDYPRSYCRDCGDQIVWMKTEKRRSIPLDLGWVRRISEAEGLGLTLYQPSTFEEGVAIVTAGPYERAGGYSCHIATCTTAGIGGSRTPRGAVAAALGSSSPSASNSLAERGGFEPPVQGFDPAQQISNPSHGIPHLTPSDLKPPPDEPGPGGEIA